MSIPNYRVQLSYDGERKVYTARAPELEHASGEGATRAEAIAKLEEEMDAQVHLMRANGSHPPVAIDEARVGGEIAVKLSATLHRELLWMARQDGVGLDHLAGELLAAAVEARRTGRPGARGQQQRHAVDPDNIGNVGNVGGGGNGGGNAGGNRGNDRRGGGFGGRYNPNLMEDRANFIEYVRGLEHGASAPTVQSRGPGGGGNGGGDRRRRRGGGSGGGGNGGSSGNAGNANNRGPGGGSSAGGGGNRG